MWFCSSCVCSRMWGVDLVSLRSVTALYSSECPKRIKGKVWMLQQKRSLCHHQCHIQCTCTHRSLRRIPCEMPKGVSWPTRNQTQESCRMCSSVSSWKGMVSSYSMELDVACSLTKWPCLTYMYTCMELSYSIQQLAPEANKDCLYSKLKVDHIYQTTQWTWQAQKRVVHIPESKPCTRWTSDTNS